MIKVTEVHAHNALVRSSRTEKTLPDTKTNRHLQGQLLMELVSYWYKCYMVHSGVGHLLSGMLSEFMRLSH